KSAGESVPPPPGVRVAVDPGARPLKSAHKSAVAPGVVRVCARIVFVILVILVFKVISLARDNIDDGVVGYIVAAIIMFAFSFVLSLISTIGINRKTQGRKKEGVEVVIAAFSISVLIITAVVGLLILISLPFLRPVKPSFNPLQNPMR
ncbi:MAG: hypothetical protein LBS90_01945, partial [Oscillospiraceae bacterium]|nr:hypothetical protein [Oscillospiraceae bacterium]